MSVQAFNLSALTMIHIPERYIIVDFKHYMDARLGLYKGNCNLNTDMNFKSALGDL